MKATTPQNQWSLVVQLLIENGNRGITMKDACKVLFFKMQSRLGELEKSLDHNGKQRKNSLKIRRSPITQKNRFGHTMTYYNYKSLAPKSYLTNLLKKLNKHGLNQPVK